MMQGVLIGLGAVVMVALVVVMPVIFIFRRMTNEEWPFPV